jgi:flagellar hook-associated protein 3 FlgL
LFSGANVTVSPLPQAEDLLQQLTSDVGHIADPQQRAAAIEAWFTSDGAGYEQSYAGSDDQRLEYSLSSGDRITASTTAMDPDIRQFLAQAATAALVPEVDVLETVGAELAASSQNFAEKSGLIGLSESRLETMSVRDAAERSALEIQITEMTVPDLYEAAVQLEENQQALERMYLVTSKLSSMSLADYL